MQIDLNADMGESFGRWKLGHDEDMLDVVTSANIACGWHAGDAMTMAHVMGVAVEKGVGIGAHPGFDDLKGFGRRRMNLPLDELRNLVTYQLGAARAMAVAAGGHVRHLKLHGALANMAAESLDMALACYDAALRVDPDLIIVAMSATAQEQAVRQLDCRWAGEVFADRLYNDDATLMDRSLPGAVVSDADQAARAVLAMIRDQAVTASSGHQIPCRIDTVCVHGDNRSALEMATNLRHALMAQNVTLSRFTGN